MEDLHKIINEQGNYSSPIEMYEVPGHGEVNQFIVDRLQSSDDRYLEKIRSLAATNKQSSLGAPSLPIMGHRAVMWQRQNMSSEEPARETSHIFSHIPEDQRFAFVTELLDSQDKQMCMRAINALECMSSAERSKIRNIIRTKLLNIVDNQAGIMDMDMLRHALILMRQTPIVGRSEIRERMIKHVCHLFVNSDTRAQEEIVKVIFDFSAGETIKWLDLMVKNANIDISLFIKTPLYKKNNIGDSVFAREEFTKTGSETTLLGGSLKEKIIIRHIDPAHFLSWKELYEDSVFWRDHGFDYVPIEPIVSYRLEEKEGRVAVFSGVLDLNLAQWTSVSNLFQKELDEQRQKILRALRDRGFRHGHDHRRNFCLRFMRDENGKPRLDVSPRLYMIDFDQSVST